MTAAPCPTILWEDALRRLGFSELRIRELARETNDRVMQDRVPLNEHRERHISWEAALARLYPHRVERRDLLQRSLHRCLQFLRETLTHLATLADRLSTRNRDSR